MSPHSRLQSARAPLKMTVLPQGYFVVDPARAASSHSASDGRR